MDVIIKSIDKVISLYSIDTTKISLLGFSQGCILSIALALNHPHKFKNIIGLSGYVCKEFLNLSSNKDDYKHLEFYCSHGTFDEIIPINRARNTEKFLKKLNIKHQYCEFPVGHSVPPQNFHEFTKWLKKRI